MYTGFFFFLSLVCVSMNFPRLLFSDLMKSCIFCKICSFTLHILHWITFYCQKTAYDQQLDFKCGNDRPGGPLAKLAEMFWDHFNKRSAAREGFGLVSFCFLMQSLDCRDDRMFSFVTWVIDRSLACQCCITL